jgi:fermentation-respiration switch protein FrsA (DUF1100 family)
MLLFLQNLKSFHLSIKRILFGGLSGGIGILGLLLAGALFAVETLTRPKKLNPFDHYAFSPYELGLPAEAVTFPSLHGNHNVSGYYIPCPGATSTLLVCPGYRSRMAEFLGIGALLWRAGYNVLVFEYYGHGIEVSTPVTLGYREINDFLGAVAYAKERAPENHLGALSYSMGAAVAIMSSARNTDVEALVVDSSFATHRGVVEYNFHRTFHLPSAPFAWIVDYLLWWRAGYRFRQVEPLREIAHIAPRPILIIHGGRDSLVDPKDATLLYTAAKEPKELWILSNADHCGAYFEDRHVYVKKILDFFDLHLNNIGYLQLIDSASTEQIRSGNPKDSSQDLLDAS